MISPLVIWAARCFFSERLLAFSAWLLLIAGVAAGRGPDADGAGAIGTAACIWAWSGWISIGFGCLDIIASST